MHFDCVVIGGGPAGYTAALKATALNAKVALIDKGTLGGTCLHEGCIPTKTLLSVAGTYRKIQQAAEIGIHVHDVTLNWSEALAHKQSVVSTLEQRIRNLLQMRGVTLFQGEARISGPQAVEIRSPEGRSLALTAHRVILCPGSVPTSLPNVIPDGQVILSTTDMLNLKSIPQSLLVIGGGAIGCETATLFASLGCTVTMVEIQPELIPGEDPEVGETLAYAFDEHSIQVYLKSKLLSLENTGNGLRAILQTPEKTLEIQAEKCVLATGRVPNLTPELGLTELGMSFTAQGIPVNAYLQTSVPWLYAAGDVIPSPQLAHVAYYEGRLAAENAILGNHKTSNYSVIPRCIFTTPEIALLGQTDGSKITRPARTVRVPLALAGRNLAEREPFGFVKLVFDPQYGQILGATIVGREASELITVIAALMEAEGTIAELARLMIPHPTSAEILREAALLAKGEPFHYE